MRVFVECYHDGAVVEALGSRSRDVHHEGGKGNVLNRLREAADEAVGLVDEDTGATQPIELSNYQERDQEHGLRLLQHQADHRKKLVVVCPRLEEWLYARASGCDVDLTRHGLPGTARQLHKIARGDRSQGFRDFLRALAEKDAGMRQLREWLRG